MGELAVFVCIAVVLAGCHRSEPPVDLVKTQRDTLNQAKAVEGQLQQAQDRLKAAEDAQK
jgi:outer membrane PBP1 activator LpoA protein